MEGGENKNMFKKLAALAGAGAMLLSIATPAFAHSVRNRATVNQTTISSANTGGNGQGNGASVTRAHVSGDVEVRGSNNMDTGVAESSATGVVVANTNLNLDCDSCTVTPRRQKNTANVIQMTSSSANTGLNDQGNSAYVERAGIGGEVEVKGNNTMTTGDAESSATGVVVVNTQVSLD